MAGTTGGSGSSGGTGAGGAACGTCAICLSELGPREEAFLDTCFHHFHLQCIQRWVAVQLERLPASGLALACPLCRRPFASAVYDCEGDAYRRQYFAPAGNGRRSTAAGAAGPSNGSGSLNLTAHHRRRRAVYSLPLPAGEQERRRQLLMALERRPQQAQRADVERFVERELQALMLQPDVALVAQHVVATLRNAAAAPQAAAGAAAGGARARLAVGSLAGSGRRSQPAHAMACQGAVLVPRQQQRLAGGSALAHKAGVAASSAGGAAAAAAGGSTAGMGSGPPAAAVQVPSIVRQLQAAAAPFVFEHAERFAWEVAAFVAAGSASLAAYDRHTLQLDAAEAAAAGASARQQLQEQRREQRREQPAGHSSESGMGYRFATGSGGGSSSGEEESQGKRPGRSVEAQRSDSDGYLDLLLQQGARRRHAAAAQQQQQRTQEQEAQAAVPSQRHDSGSDSGRRKGRCSRASRSSSLSRSRSRSRSGSRGQRGESPSLRHRRQHRKHKRRKQKSRSRRAGTDRGTGSSRRRRAKGGSRSRYRSRSRRRSSSRSGGSSSSSGRRTGSRGRSTSRAQRGRGRSRSRSTGRGNSPRGDELAALRHRARLAHQRHQQGRLGEAP